MIEYKDYVQNPETKESMRIYEYKETIGKKIITVIDFQERPFSEKYMGIRFTNINNGDLWIVKYGKLKKVPFQNEWNYIEKNVFSILNDTFLNSSLEEEIRVKNSVISTRDLYKVISIINEYNLRTFEKFNTVWFYIDME